MLKPAYLVDKHGVVLAMLVGLTVLHPLDWDGSPEKNIADSCHISSCTGI